MTAQDAITQWKEKTEIHLTKMIEDPEYKKNFEKNPIDFLAEKFVEFAEFHRDKTLQNAISTAIVKFMPYDEEGWSKKEITKEDFLNFYSRGSENSDYAYERLKERDGFSIQVDQDSIRYSSFIIK